MEVSVNSEILSTLNNSIKSLMSNPEIFAIIIAVVIAFISKMYLGSSDFKSFNQTLGETILYTFLAFIIISNSVKYLFGIEIVTTISDILTNNPLIEIDILKESDIKNDSLVRKEKKVKFSDKNEVFHIKGNNFQYKDATPVCKAYGAKLATYDQVENAYNNGAEFCEYGWSDDQLALFPTQKKTWNEMQKGNSKVVNTCGRPGVNGGYIENPNVRFGVNCYGVKPDISKQEKCMMTSTGFYENPEAKVETARTNYWESRLSELIVSPFNENKWNKM